MPHINRVRVNNVKYNFGTQFYDDFHMGFYGKNTIYDLANGGGKSILMLLLLQNLIPNCTLDEKQPIEKLFRSGNDNTTIHSMIEWKLSDVHVKNNYKYLLTGFCARKARDNSLEEDIEGEENEAENASIEYFNYCIFYREFNDNDIKNFPLSKDNERMSYNNLRNYLKELARKDLSLEIKIFDRKGEYQRFISQYGLYESEWEIIRGINKTEGHVRTYFETNYKTTRKVVEDLLIEEIIQKSFNNRIENSGEDDYMAKTLLDIKDKLVELSNKKEDISNYERQIEVVDGFVSRIIPIKQMYFGKERLEDEILKSVNSIRREIEESNALLEKCEEDTKEYQSKKNLLEYEIEAAKIIRLTKEEEGFIKKLEELETERQEKAEASKALKEKLKVYESINNYDDYLYYKKERDIQKNMVENALKDKGDILDELRELTGAKRKFNDERFAVIESEMFNLEEIISKEKTVYGELENKIKTLDKDMAVETYLVKEYTEKSELLQRDIKEKMEETSIYFTSNVASELDKLIKDKEETQLKLEKAKEEYSSINEKIVLSKEELTACDKNIESVDEKIMELSEKRASLLEISDKFSKMTEVYEEKNLDNLIALLKIKMEEVSEELEEAKKELLVRASNKKFLEQGCPVGSSKEIAKVLSYIERYYGKVAVEGCHYMTTLTRDEKTDVLERIPFLPYSIVIKDKFEEIISDAKLKELDLGNYTVPIIKAEVVLGMEKVIDYANVSFVMYSNELFIDEFARDREIAKHKIEMENLEGRITRLSEVKNVYEEDLTFLREYLAIWKQEIELVNKAYEELRIKRKEMVKEKEDMTLTFNTMLDNVEISEKLCQNIEKDLNEISGKYESTSRLWELVKEDEKYSKGVRESREKLERLGKEKKDHYARFEATEQSIEDRKKNLLALQEEKKKLQKEWNDIYKMYYSEESKKGEILFETMDEGAVTSRFLALAKISESDNIDIADKQKLIENYDIAMEKSLQAIDYKGIDLELVRKEYEASPIKNIETKELITIRDNIEGIEDEEKKLIKDISILNSQKDKNSGAIYNAKEMIKEKYGEYTPIDMELSEYEEYVASRKDMLLQAKNSVNDVLLKIEELNKKLTRLTVLERDMDKIIRNGNITNRDKNNYFDSYVNLEEKIESVISQYDKFNKEILVKKDEFMRNKEMLTDTLTKLGGVMLAQDIKENVMLPDNIARTEELMDSLMEVSRCLGIERDRIEKSIEDMERIKDNFENQCIQTCINIKNELDRLPKLSKIYMDNEAISIIGLSIPYVNEEHYKKRMSDYIDEIVSSVDNIKSESEKVKYIRSQLSWKRMFSVIVSDMNRIKLNLYKRERIKEQSRYLRYEEAVGSTGQSQGIYIQFLIAIINYISSINSRNSDSTSIGKVIFIDNPFGAAKDVYIWEPIFKLLKTNNVQMIVPARGATPAITGRFDVNYILGQKLVGGKQQTVVVDYLSNVDSDKLDYKRMEFSQETLF